MALRVDVVWTGLGGSPYFSSFFFNLAGAGSDAQDAADAVGDAMNGLESIVSSALSWQVQNPVILFDPTDGSPTGTASITNPVGQGTDSAQVLPRATQGLAQFFTNVFLGGRQVRGHMFIPGPTEAVNDANGNPSSGYTSGALAQFTTHLLTPGLEWAVWSRKSGQLVDINSVGVSTKWAVLRSRRD